MNTKQYLKIIGIESIWMILVVISECVCYSIQLTERGYVYTLQNIIFSTTVSKYNLTYYILGLVLFIIVLVSTYLKIMKKQIKQLVNYKAIYI